MRPEHRVLLFAALVVATYIYAGTVLVDVLVRRLRRLPQNLSWRSKLVLALAALGLVCIGYGRFIEPYWPQVTHVSLTTPKFAKGTRGIRIVQISDVHSDPKPRLEEKLPKLIAAEKPDFIVFTGDASNSFKGTFVFTKLMRELTKIAPVYVVRGNWDQDPESANIFFDTGVREANGAPSRVEINGDTVVIAGTGTEDQKTVETVFAYTNPAEFRIFLHHFPDRIYEAAVGGVDLYLAGHTHGGQVALPFYGALITFSRFDKRFESGLYRVKDTWLYVNRGIGMEGGAAPRVRFWARPEVTIVDIKPAS